MRRLCSTGLTFLGIFFLLSADSFAAVPQLITYQGFLQDSAGAPVADDQYSIQFAVYDSLTGGKDLWNSGFVKVVTTDGLFTIDLGNSHMPEIPTDLCTDTSLYLGITLEGLSEMTPRTRLVSVPYSYHALRADTASAVDWSDLDNVPAGFADGIDNIATSIDWANVDNIPAGFADGIDNTGGDGDITAVLAGTGLEGGGTSGDITLHLNDTIPGTHYYTGTNVFRLRTYFAGVNSSCSTDVNNNFIYGIESKVKRTNPIGDYGYTIGVHGDVSAPLDERYGVYGYAEGDGTRSNGNSYGVRSIAWDGADAYAFYGFAYNAHHGYGIYAGATTDHNDIAQAGHFYGDVSVSGTLSKGGGSFKIDHPLDPERKYLQHSFVESPDMMNVYNGNITTDNNGYAAVTLPDYFSVLNKDFRYQLTVIGDFAQAIIAEEISGNQFVIRTDKPDIKVSWQVTGVRQDNWANAHRIEVEVDKPAEAIGKYLHSKENGQPIEKDIEYQHIKQAREEYESRR